MDATISSLIAVITALGYAGLIGVAWRYRESAGPQLATWIFPTLALGGIVSLLGLVPDDIQLLGQETLGQPALVVFAASLVLVCYGGLTLTYLQQHKLTRIWLVVGGAWWVALVALSLTDEVAGLSNPEWFNDLAENSPTGGVIAIAGWIAIGGLLLIYTFQKFYTARLPELANQALFWGVVMPLVLLGIILSASGVEFLHEMGWIILLVGLAGATYGVIALRVVDIRETLRAATVNMLLILITTIAMLIALLVADEIEAGSSVSRLVLLAGLALATATLHTPAYLVVANLTNRLILRQTDNAAEEISRFAQAITGVVEMDELSEVVAKTLRDALRVNRACLILATNEEQNGEVMQLETYGLRMGEVPQSQGQVRIDDPIHQHLYEKRKPLRQYELDYAREYADVDVVEREFFRHLQMAAFAPIVVHGQLIGILACGSKSSDTPFSDDELELLSTIGNQTGIALRTARLIDDLRTREHDVAESAKHLESAKRQLEALDAVKTDFITIASHELRTPLAQMRGHTDIIDALNEQGMMDQDQLRGLTSNLRKAADRLETLIGDMLDVSQLDLSAMDLRFVQAGIENVVRMAIEPLQESIRNRKQSLTARGLRGLPNIQADMQRLVQAIRNVVLNAVKFTPDGGRIDIIGSLVKNTQTGQDEVQLVIKDSGIGIDKKNQEAIFEKFFRVGDPGLHSTGTTKFMGAGPGLGLTIAKGVITGHGGRITIESDGFDPDKLPGSTFTIYLPLKPPSGERRVMTFGTVNIPSLPPRKESEKVDRSESSPVAKTEETSPVEPESEAPSQQPEIAETVDAEDEEEPFVEVDPTILNPSASRAGLAAAAIAAAQKAAGEVESESPDDDTQEQSAND